MRIRQVLLGKTLLLAVFLFATSANAGLVTNGSFEGTTGSSPSFFIGNGGTGSLNAWTLGSVANASNSIVFASGSADGAGATRSDGVQFGLWGPGSGVNNGLTASSPDGGNYLAMDGDILYNVTLNQTITGLNVGQQYQLSFYWAAAQYNFINGASYGQPGSFTGATTNSWQVSLGGQTFTTPVVSIASQGFSGWMSQSFTYVATSSSEVLSFLAVGGPNGLPPVALLDGVSLTPVPEPATWSMMLMGAGGLGALGVYRRKSSKA